MAMLQVTDQYVELHDKEVVIVHKASVEITKLDGTVVERAPYTAELDMSDIEKGTYPHYMLKEMDERPTVIRKIIQAYEGDNGDLTIDAEILEALRRQIVYILLRQAQAIMRVLLVNNILKKWLVSL